MKIAEEIGDRAGVANSLGQLGLLYEKMDQVQHAIPVLVKAFILFAGMGMPQAGQAKRCLNRLRTKVGEETFLNILQATGLAAETQSAILQALADRPTQSDAEQPDLRTILIQNTIAMLTNVPDKKGEWWEQLRKLEKQAKEQNEQVLAGYLKGLLGLVEGADPARLIASIPEEFKSDWQTILDGISKRE